MLINTQSYLIPYI